MQERRHNVRARPLADYAVDVDYGTGLVKAKLVVLDVAVGGLGLQISEPIEHLERGDDLPIGLSLPGLVRFETVGAIRYTQGHVGGRCGVHLNRLSAEQQHALSRTVSELLERGASV